MMEKQMVDFREMPYARPNIDEIKIDYESMTDKLKNAEIFADALAAFEYIQEREKNIETTISLCSVRNTIDTTDEYYAGEIKWLREQSAMLIPLRKQYHKTLAESPFRADFEKQFGAQFLRLIDNSLKISDEKIIPDTIRENEICQQYQKDSATAVTEFRGEQCNFYGLLKHMEFTDREERKEAFHAWAALYEKISPPPQKRMSASGSRAYRPRIRLEPCRSPEASPAMR